ncbi:BBP7 family outer membrane beta-barrel protein [Leptolyngbya iicbica]|uniref:Uncharacterized protein n=2 Tax=Cyanophyceae TaxID=3028117 RepID=A0A4Q7E4D9_9CYAN|nr:BBP7 family outer membrane beta-barrel protein [Leptolyngbya sp. LK]RZM76574.1 hypothetical protein DYY88_18085 [Leptolyngbya sp. LK]
MNFGTVSGIDLRLCAVLSISLALGTGPALAQTEADEKATTASPAINLSNYFAADGSGSGTVVDERSPQVFLEGNGTVSPRANRTEATAIAQVFPAPYSTTAGDLAPTVRDRNVAAIAQAEDADPDAATETESTTAPTPIETRVLGSEAQWEIGADVVFLRRSIPNVTTSIDGQINPDDGSLLGNTNALGTGALDFGLDTGARFSVGYYPDPQTGYELAFMGLQDWRDTETFVSAGNENLRVAFIDPVRAGQDDAVGLGPNNTDQVEDFVQARSHTLRYESELDSLEFNYRHALTPPSERSFATLIAGLRYMSIDEGFDLISDDGATRLGGNIGTYEIDTSNDLVGVQIGLDSGVQLTPALGLGLSARAGLMLNFNDQSSEFVNDNGIPTVLTGSDSDTSLSPMFQVEGSARWDVTDNFTLKTGYQFLAVGNVATAPSQYGPLEDLGDLERSSALYHGPFVGLELRF